MAILVTGGAGYIGSHTVLSLLERGEDVVVLDNLSNSSAESLQRVEKLSGKAAEFHQGDVQDAECLQRIFGAHEITAVIHFAGAGYRWAHHARYDDCRLHSDGANARAD